jgi:hypothetical protein
MARFIVPGLQGPQGATGPAGEDAVLGIEIPYTVTGGTLGTQPTFDGAPLFYGSYVKNEQFVHFQIQVDFDNIISFGTGQYYVDLPFPVKYEYTVRDGCLHDISTGSEYHISGHAFSGETTLLLSTSVKIGNSVEDAPFSSASPVTLNVADNFHIAGTYIAESEES